MVNKASLEPRVVKTLAHQNCESLHLTIKEDKEKTMRGLKTKDTPILQGYQIFHNYIRPHEGLEGKTPSEACGIKVKGDNKWVTLIQNAAKKDLENHRV
jgi:hypothetical protein